jgi:hypothetical protein
MILTTECALIEKNEEDFLKGLASRPEPTM